MFWFGKTLIHRVASALTTDMDTYFGRTGEACHELNGKVQINFTANFIVYWHPFFSADMNGERRSRILTTNLGWPNGLTVDKREKRLYWTDAHIKHIESSDFDGNFRRIVLSDVPHPYGLAVKDNALYWTDWKTKALHMAQVDNVNKQSVITMNLEGLMDVKIVEVSFTDKITRFTDKRGCFFLLQHEPQQSEQNACGTNNGGCSHLCLRKPNGCSCKCPTGIKLKAGSTTECEALPNVSIR
jgi:low-density lipoprotein receptor-related protein 4